MRLQLVYQFQTSSQASGYLETHRRQGPATVTLHKRERGVLLRCGADRSRWPDRLQPHPRLRGAVASPPERSPGDLRPQRCEGERGNVTSR